MSGPKAYEAWELLRAVAAEVEAGAMPVLDVGGGSAEAARALRAIASRLETECSVVEAMRLARREGMEFAPPHLGDDGAPRLEQEIDIAVLRYTFGGSKGYGMNVSWVPVNKLAWFAQVLGSNLERAYEAGRTSMRYEARKAAEGVIELLGLKTHWK